MPPYGTDYEFSLTYTRCGFADITDPVLSDSARERANASVDETRTRTMFTQFTPKARTSTSQDRRGELKETHKEIEAFHSFANLKLKELNVLSAQVAVYMQNMI